MKTFKNQCATILILFVALSARAQVSVNVNVGVPVWAPAAPPAVGFYYLPEIQTYYDVHASNFIYLDRGRWIRSPRLPHHYRHYDLRHGRTVYLTDYRGHHPYHHFKAHRNRYYANAYAPHYARPATRVKVREYHDFKPHKGHGHYKQKKHKHHKHDRD